MASQPFNVPAPKREMAALRESEERYRALFERSLDAVYIHDFEGNFLDANDAALNLLGYTAEEIRSLNFASLLSEDQFQIAFGTLDEVRKTGSHKDLVTFELKKKDGSFVWVETKALSSFIRETPTSCRVSSAISPDGGRLRKR